MNAYEPHWISSQAPASTSSMKVPLPAPVTIGHAMPASASSRLVCCTCCAAVSITAWRSSMLRMCCARP